MSEPKRPGSNAPGHQSLVSTGSFLKANPRQLMKQDPPTYLDSARDLFDEAPCGYLHLDPSGQILAINATLLEWLGYRKEEVVGKMGFPDLLSMEGKRYYEAHHSPLEHSQGFVRELNYDLVRKTGGRFPVLITSKRIVAPDEGGDPYYRYIVFNITDRRKYERELLQAKKAAEEASRAKDIFLARVSHEIRTPMHAVLSITDFLGETSLSSDQRAMLNTLRFSANSLLDFIGEVHELSRLDAGDMPLYEQNFPIRELCRQLVRNTELLLRDRPVEVILDCADDIPDFLYGDVGKLRKVLNNLLVNASQFTERGHIVLDIQLAMLRPSNCRLQIAVRDTGVGIPEDKIDSLFEPFSQSAETESKAVGMGGLGLAISRQLVALLGGELTVSSERGKGTEFTFSLRLAPGDTPAPLKQATEVKRMTLEGLRVLLVEDNQTNIYIAARILRNKGAEIDVAENGKDALLFAAETAYDIILMDLQMPILDGFAATKQLRQLARNASTPVVALTAARSSEVDDRLVEAGIDGYLLKPFDAEELLQTILRYCRKSEVTLTAGPRSDSDADPGRSSVDPTELYELIGRDDVEGNQELLLAMEVDLKRQSGKLGQAVEKQDIAELRAIRHALKTILRLTRPEPLLQLLDRAISLLAGNPAKAELTQCARLLDQALEAAIKDLDALRRSL